MTIDISTIGIAVDTGGLERGQKALKDTENAANRTADAADKTSTHFKSLSSAIDLAKNAMAAYLSLQTVRVFVQTADAIALMDARLKLATQSTTEFVQAQKDVFAIAQRNSIGLQETATLYTKLADPIRSMGGTAKETAGIVDAFAKTLKISGASSQEAASATLQFAQAMASGKLQGDEFRAMSETSPRFMKAMAEGMGIPIGKLKEMGSEGKLTAGVVGGALLQSLEKLTSEAKTMPDTVGNAFTRLKNEAQIAIDTINKQSNMTLGVAGAIDAASQLIPLIRDELASAFKAVGSWINENKSAISETFEAAKSLASEVWEVYKAGVSVVGALTQAGAQAGIVKTAIEAIRLLVAGLGDGVQIVGAAFATVGGIIMKTVLTPFQWYLEGLAKVQGFMGNVDSSNSLTQAASSIREFASAGSKYGDDVVAKFARGESAVGRLNAEMANGKVATDAVGKSVESVNGNFKKLKDAATDAKAVKAVADEYAKLSAEIAKQLALSQAELDGNGKLEASEKYRITTLEKLIEQYQAGKITLKEYIDLESKMNDVQGVMKKAEAQAKAAKAAQAAYAESLQYQDDVNKALREEEDARNRIRLAVGANTVAAEEAQQLAQLEMQTVFASAEDRKRILDYYRIELDLRKKIAAINSAGGIDQAERDRLIAIETANAARLKGVADMGAAMQSTTSIWQSIDQTAHSVWTNVLQGGQDIWSKLKNTAKTIFFDWLYQMTLKKWIFSIGATITGSGTMAQTAASAGGGNLFQTGSNLYSAYSNGSSLYTIGSQYAAGTMSGANAAGSLFANATGTGIDGLLLTNGAYGTAAGAGTAGTAGAAGAAGAEAGAGAGAAGIGAGATLGLAALAYLAYTDWNDDSHKTIRNGGGYKADKNGNIVLDQGTGIGPSTAKPIYDQEGMLTGNYAPDGNLFGGRLLDANGSDVLATRSAASIAYGNTLLGRFGSKATFNDFSGGAASSNVGEGIAYAGATVNGKKIGVSDALDKLAQRGSMTDAQTVDEYTRLLEVLNIGGLQAAKLAGPMGDYLDKLGDVSTMTKKAADATLVMINTYADFQDTFKNSPFDNLKTASVEASAQLVKVAGDIGTLAGVTANYYDLFATDAEKQAHALGLAKDAFSAIGVIMPELDGKTREWYKSEVARLGAMDLSVEANAKAYAGALKLASGVDALAKAEEQAATTRQSWQDQLNVLTGKTTDTALQMQRDLASTTDESTQALIRAVYAEKDRQKAMSESATAMQKMATDQAAAAQKSADAYKSALSAQQSYYASLTSAGDAVRNLLAGLKTGVNAGTSPQSRLEAARAQYLQDLSAARGGDFAAYNRVATTAQTYIGAGSDMYASSAEQKAILAQVQSELQNLPAVSQYDANLAQLKAIEDAIKSNTTSTNGAIGTLNTETLAAIASMTGTLSNNFASIDINNNGVLTFDELKAGLNIGEELTRQLIASVDLNGDGQISQLEVIKANTANTTASLDAQKIDTLAAIASMTATLSNNFSTIDINGSGLITFAEMKDALGTGDTLTQQLINAIDTNGDGQISKLEIIAANTFGLDTLARINASVNSINWTDKAAAVAQFTPLAQANGWTLQQIAAATGYNLSDIQALFSGSPLATGMNAKGFSSTSKTGSTAAAPIGISSGPSDASWAGTSNGLSAGRAADINTAVQALDWNNKAGAATDIWNKAYYLGWSEQDIATATGYNLSDIDALFKNAGLPAFASGGSHMGGLRIVGENGPELEATGPSRIWNAADTANMLRGGGDNQALITEVRELRKEVAKAKESDTPIHVTVMTHDGKKLAEQVISTIKERSRNREVVIYANGVGAATR